MIEFLEDLRTQRYMIYLTIHRFRWIKWETQKCHIYPHWSHRSAFIT